MTDAGSDTLQTIIGNGGGQSERTEVLSPKSRPSFIAPIPQLQMVASTNETPKLLYILLDGYSNAGLDK